VEKGKLGEEKERKGKKLKGCRANLTREDRGFVESPLAGGKEKKV